MGGVAYAAMKPGAAGAASVSELLGFPAISAFVSTVAFAIAKLLAKKLMTKDLKVPVQ